MGAYKDELNNTWKSKFSYQDSNGKTRWTTKRGFKTKKAALDYERQFLLSKAGEVDMTFASFISVYESEYFGRLKESTAERKRAVIDKHILPFFGAKKLNEISKRDVITWQNQLLTYKDPISKKKFSKSYIKTVHNQLSAILNYAVKYYDLHENVAAKVGNCGSNDEVKIDFWTEQEYEKFRNVMMDRPVYYYAYETLYWTGMREGELLALTSDDIDLESRTISITKTYHHLKGREIITSPKTKKSVRSITIPEFLAAELDEYIKMNYQLAGTDRLFPLNKSSLSKAMASGSTKAGVKRIRIHDLRHSHISLLIRMGYSAVAIAERVGHESIEITYRYAHLFPDEQNEMAKSLDMIGGMLDGTKNSR